MNIKRYEIRTNIVIVVGYTIICVMLFMSSLIINLKYKIESLEIKCEEGGNQ
jgi:signal transduction histidine kinase